MSAQTILLASNSPRRRELLTLTGWEFHVHPADVDESLQAGEPPAAYVTRLAGSKARAVAHLAQPGWVVVAADTAVVDGAHVLGKPADAAEAVSMLRRLRGHAHQVYTALAALRPGDEAPLLDLCVTDVPMRAYSDAEIAAYAASGDPLDKAGGYAIQHAGFRPVEGLAGCYASVMGLPLCHLARTLRRLDITPENQPPDGSGVAAACQAHLEYTCPIFAAVLRGETIG